MFSNFQQKFPLQDLKQWALFDMSPLGSEIDTETLVVALLPGSIYGLIQKGDISQRPVWVIPPTTVFQNLPVFSKLSAEAITLPKTDLASSFEQELLAVTQDTVTSEIPVRVQTPNPEVPAIQKKTSTPCFNRPSTPTRPGSQINRPSTPVDVRSSFPQPPKSSLSNILSGSFSSVKRSPSIRDFLGTTTNFPKEEKSKPIYDEKIQDVSTNTISLGVSTLPDEMTNGPYTVQERKKDEQEHMALVQYHSHVMQIPLSGMVQNGSPDAPRNEPSYVTTEQVQQNLLGVTSYIKPSKDTFGMPDPQYRALISQYLKRLQAKAAKVQSQFSPAVSNIGISVPNIGISASQSNSLIRFDRKFSNYRSLDLQSDSTSEIYIDPRYQNYVHHFLRKSIWKTAAAGSSRSINEVMQELRKDSIFLNTIAPGAILQALDDAVVARLRQSLSVQDGKNSITRFGDASARMDDLRRFLESLTMDNGQCVEFEHWIEEIPEDCEQTLRIDFTGGTPKIRGSTLGPKAVRDAVRRRMKIFRPQAARESEFMFVTPVTANSTPLKRALGNKSSESSLRLYKRTRNGSSEDVSLQRPKGLTIITASDERLEFIDNASVRELVLSPINTSSTQINGQISDTLFIEPLADSSPPTPTSTAGSVEQWERSSTHSRFSMGSMGSLGSEQTALTVPYPGPALSFASFRVPKGEEEEEEEEEWDSPAIQLSLCPDQTPGFQKEDGTRLLLVSTYSRFLSPKKCRSISEITFDNPKEYRAESLKRGFSSTSSLTKLSSVARPPTLQSPVELEMPRNEERSLNVATQIEGPEDPFVFGPAPILPAEPRADSGYSNGEGYKSAQGLLKEIAAVGEDVKRVAQGSRKTTIKDAKIIPSNDAEEEIEDKTTKKSKLFGKLRDRMKGLKKKVMKGGKEN